jgi:hypothetical protein
MTYRDAIFWASAVAVVYLASWLPDLLGYAEVVN